MAKKPRIAFIPFGQDGPTDDFAVFGSKKEGSPTKTKDIALIQGDAPWVQGLKDAILASNRAAYLEDVNSVFLVMGYMLGYLFQEGVPEWDPSTEYDIGSVVKGPGTSELYASLTNGNQGNALPSMVDNTDWQYISSAIIPAGNTASRPASAKNGVVYINTEDTVLQRFSGVWSNMDLVPFGSITSDKMDNDSILTASIQDGAVTPPKLSQRFFGFGDGSDGDLNIASGTTALNGVKKYNNLTIALGATLTHDADRALTIFVKGTLTLNGSINVNGKSSRRQGIFCSAGGGGGQVGNSGAVGQIGGASLMTGVSVGGAGGTGTGTGGTGGNGSSSNYFLDRVTETFEAGCAGGVGGSGSSAGGAGGAGGGLIIIYAQNIVLGGSAVVSANGATGSAGTSSDASAGGGGGGGGGGGVAVVFFAKKTGTVTPTASGGVGGAPGGGVGPFSSGPGGVGSAGIAALVGVN